MEAIRAGVNPGLTMVVGPPGTGKTDVAVQMLSELYHNFPGQRTLVITHSNHALNDLFVKIMERDIAARHLLRLGMGEQVRDSSPLPGETLQGEQGKDTGSLCKRTCHPPREGGGSVVLLLKGSLKSEAKVRTGFIKSRNRVLFGINR